MTNEDLDLVAALTPILHANIKFMQVVIQICGRDLLLECEQSGAFAPEEIQLLTTFSIRAYEILNGVVVKVT